ncbi:YeeE/YedE thiosulfate transporter family protein [Polynucleobacter sp. JS-JIR-II-50]|uniref:YeeE/YedE thiosulfate transporter family protein n=1 Tax=Polynucleobacter sp. JS-JIR-II-50 TaxID=2576919 RepID=UPI001BFDC9C2|nr:YeeE/YedE thiosulfate transporter family protein [Polynucleobacter sp. JS-JIR-II-50]QWE05263.1 YeeE/YedE family protein [Polynucleobacter sp. JS-JIR-II-50]
MSEILSGLLLGAGFGFVLERAGFGNPNKLTGQFRLTDWSVFKVMFTAIVFAAVGLLILERFGFVDAGSLFVPPAFLGAAALGGALVGAGFAIGGYCPGTSVVGLMSGRIDAAIFLLGLLLGTVLFAGIYPTIEFVTTLGEYAKADALPDAFNISSLSIDIGMIVAAIVVFILGSWMERKSKGPVSSQV